MDGNRNEQTQKTFVDTLKELLATPKGKAAAIAAAVFIAVACVFAFTQGGTQQTDIADEGTPMATVTSFSITGGTEGVDYAYENIDYQRSAYSGSNKAGSATTKMLVIKTSTPLTISTPSGDVSSTGIRIAPGVDAYLTFNGVNITADVPCDMVTNSKSPGTTTKDLNGNPTKLHLTLADGTTNTLNANAGAHAPGLRCGEGSELYIDDSVPNVDKSGNPITPVGGFIPAGTQYVGQDGKTYTASGAGADSSLANLESRNPGKLSVQAGYRAAGIGGGSWENAGKLTFNGGDIVAKPWMQNGDNRYNTNQSAVGTNWDYGCGAGIGGGYASGGTQMYFNGGSYDIYGSYHGAAIGGGMYAYNTTSPGDWAPRSYPFADAIRSGVQPDSTSSEKTKTVPGNITINGGFIKATGGLHGNAFGQACGSWAKGCTILVTGGTLLPNSYGTLKMIGGDQGYVVITGGSVNCDKSKFGGIGDTAWGVLNGYSNNNNKVFMTTIDLSADGWVNHTITNFGLTIDGQAYDYGAPARFDNGKLYLWLPQTAVNKEVRVSLTGEKIADDGTVKQETPADLYIPKVTTDGSAKLKRYIDFKLPEDWRKTHWYKDYNGLPFPPYDFSENGPGAIMTDENPPKALNTATGVTYKYQYLDAEGNGVGEEITVDATHPMPTDASKFHIMMTSTQYSTQKGFSESYWGHRATGEAEIRKVASKIPTLKAQWYDASGNLIEEENHKAKATDKLLITAQVTSAPSTAVTCKAPTGTLELVVDGAVVETFDISRAGGTNATGKVEVKTYDDGREYVQFTYEAKASEHGYLLPTFKDDNKHVITMNYKAAKNYLDTVADEDPTVPKANVTVEPVEPDPGVVPNDDVAVTPDTSKDKDPEQGDHTYEKGYKLSYDFKEMEPVLPELPTRTNPLDPEDPDADPADTTPAPGPQPVIPPNKMTFEITSPSSGAFKVNTPTDRTVADAIKIVQKKNADGTPARNAQGEFIYEVSVDVTSAGYSLFELTQEPNGAFYGTKFLIDLTVNPNSHIDPEPKLSKTAVNVTHPQGAVQAGDTIRYTITAANDAAGSVWWFPKIHDELPASVALVEDSLHLTNPSEDFDDDLEEGQFTYEDGELSVGLGVVKKILGMHSAVLTFDVTVKDEVGTRDATDELKSVGNIATATGHKGIEMPEDGSDPKDPDDPSVPAAQKPESEPANPQPTAKAEPLNPKVLPADPVKEKVSITKTAKNANREEGLSEAGDIIEYTVTLKNQAPGSCWYQAAFLDDIPTGIVFEAGSAKLKLPTGTTVDLDDTIYDSARNRLGVSLGDIYGGEEAVLTFKGKVTEEAQGRDLGNIANVVGTLPSEKGGAKTGGSLTDPDNPDGPDTTGTATPGGSDVPEEGGKPYLPPVDDITDIVTKGGLPSDPTDPASARGPVQTPERAYGTPDDKEQGERINPPAELDPPTDLGDGEFGGGRTPEDFEDNVGTGEQGIEPAIRDTTPSGDDGGNDDDGSGDGTEPGDGDGDIDTAKGDVNPSGVGGANDGGSQGGVAYDNVVQRALAATGDPMFWVICGVVVVAVAAGAVLVVSRRKNGKQQ